MARLIPHYIYYKIFMGYGTANVCAVYAYATYIHYNMKNVKENQEDSIKFNTCFFLIAYHVQLHDEDKK